MNSFQYYLYSSRAQKEKSDLEKVFENLIKKIELYEKQYEITLRLYRSEWDKELKEQGDIYRKALKKAEEVYIETYNEMDGEDEEMRQSFADHESGLTILNYENCNEEENIKERYLDFFDLYSKSLLIALYSLIESKLKQICDIITIDFGQKIRYDHLDSRDYLNTALNYFDLVIQIPIDTIKPFISKLKDVQFIRNRIIHTESEFTKENEKTIRNIVNQSSGSLELKIEQNIKKLGIKKSQYIIDFFELIRELFEELIWLIDIKQNHKILLKGLEYWFGILDNKIFIRIVESTKVGKGRRKKVFDLSSRKRSIPKLRCEIIISRLKDNSLEIVDQTNKDIISKFNELVNNMKSFLYDYVFELFNQSLKGIKIRVMMFER